MISGARGPPSSAIRRRGPYPAEYDGGVNWEMPTNRSWRLRKPRRVRSNCSFSMSRPRPLTPHEVEGLFGITRRPARRGKAIVFISHRFEEVFAIAGPDGGAGTGTLVSNRPAGNATRDRAIADMTGRVGFFSGQRQETVPGEPSLRGRSFALSPCRTSHLHRQGRGEVLGDLRARWRRADLSSLEVLAGARRGRRGKRGVSRRGWFCPTTQKRHGLAASLSSRRIARGPASRAASRFFENTRAGCSPPELRLALRQTGEGACSAAATEAGREGRQRDAARRDALGRQPAESRAGRVACPCRRFCSLLDEPTRGIDVRTKSELYTLIGEQAGLGIDRRLRSIGAA